MVLQNKDLLETNDAFFEIRNGIFYGTFKSQLIDLETAKRITNTRIEYQESFPYLIISNIKNVKNSTKEARDFMASAEGCEGVTAAAILINSAIGSMIGNFFIRISNPLRPTKIFTTEKDAIAWLAQFIK